MRVMSRASPGAILLRIISVEFYFFLFILSLSCRRDEGIHRDLTFHLDY